MKNIPKYTGIKKHNYNKLITLALQEYEKGNFVTISELAELAKMSRATAYRYFPTHSDLISNIVEHSLGPIFQWQSDKQDVVERVEEFLSFAFIQMLKHEGALRAALEVSLNQWAKERELKHTQTDKLIRGNRKEILEVVLQPLKVELSPELYNRVIRAISIIYGSEIFMVLKDIWQMDNEGVIKLAQWISRAIIEQAKLENSNLNNGK